MKITELTEGYSPDGFRFNVTTLRSVDTKQHCESNGTAPPKSDEVGDWTIREVGGSFSETHRATAFAEACKKSTASYCRAKGSKFAHLVLV